MILSAVLEPEESSFLCIVHDISARHEIEAVKQEVVSMFTHDLRTPLTAINFSIDILSKKPELASHQITLERARTNVKTMAILIDDLLDLYKTEAGMMNFDEGRFKARDLCDAAVEEVLDAATHLDVAIDRIVPDGLIASGDAKASLRILVNLLSNALKYSPAKSVVTLSVTANDKQIAISVSDKGPGINAEELPFVFDRFSQTSSSKGSRLPGLGTGLGLAICKAFAERQGGKITVSSTVGKGSTFTCILPRAS